MTFQAVGRYWRSLDLTATGWPRVFAATFFGTLLCVASALLVDSMTFSSKSAPEIELAIFVDIALPIALAGPLLFLLTYKMRQLAIAYAKLLVLATTDSLTDLLNRQAFTVLVESVLERSESRLESGALLIVDADNFKTINDTLGHERGDAALKIIAQAMRGALRGADIIGRIGGEEFGVLLRGADSNQAAVAAERIRSAISGAVFKSNGSAWPLTVSVGGVNFLSATSYGRLFAAADKLLYAAKAGGRDQVKMGVLEPAGLCCD